MKIAIMTVPFNNNYGGFLQAYALKTVLNNMGHSTIFIMRRRNRPDRYINLKSWILRREKHLYYLDDIHLYRISKYTRRFQKKYLYPYTRDYYNSIELQECRNLDVDCFIAGSDQCWRYKFAPNNIDDFFFNFLKGSGKKRISYAASLGTSDLEYDDQMLQKCKSLLCEFRAISVRESSGVDLLVNYFGVKSDNVKVTLDPTLLLTIDAYKELFKVVKKERKDYMFSYILDDDSNKTALLNSVSQKLNLPIVSQKAQVGNVRDLKTIEPVELWLSRIYNSSFVITDSFHGCVFSILFNKPFIVYGNPNRGLARFDSLLRLFGLESRYLDINKGISINTLGEIDWVEVNKRLDGLRNESLSFLKEALNK